MEQETAATAPVVNNDKKCGGKGWKIATIFAFILAIAGIGFGVYSFMDSNNKSQEISDLKAQIAKQNEQEEVQNKAYKVGDSVTLKDGTSWIVIKNSDVNNDNVVLLSVDLLNTSGDIKFTGVKSYLQNEYKNSISNTLGVNVDARLLTLGDISELSGIDVPSLVPGESLENGITPAFLYEATTLISDDANMILDANNPYIICTPYQEEYHEYEPGRICESTMTDHQAFRVVITVTKKAL
jgi:hypothetical protein